MLLELERALHQRSRSAKKSLLASIHHFAGSRVWTLLFCGEIIRPRPVLRQNTVGDIVSRDGFEAPRVAIRGIMTRMTAFHRGEYSKRIGYAGTARPDLATLTALHRAHVGDDAVRRA